MSIQSYRDLRVWQEAMALSVLAYRIAKRLPKDELFGMTSQIRRSSASIPANIAEGYGRENRGNYVQFLRIAQGSLKELETHILLAERVELLAQLQIQPLMEQSDIVGKMLRSLIRSLENSKP
jgi:four helix bundle protein